MPATRGALWKVRPWSPLKKYSEAEKTQRMFRRRVHVDAFDADGRGRVRLGQGDGRKGVAAKAGRGGDRFGCRSGARRCRRSGIHGQGGHRIRSADLLGDDGKGRNVAGPCSRRSARTRRRYPRLPVSARKNRESPSRGRSASGPALATAMPALPPPTTTVSRHTHKAESSTPWVRLFCLSGRRKLSVSWRPFHPAAGSPIRPP